MSTHGNQRIRNPRGSTLQQVFIATDFSAGGAQAVARAGRLPLAAGGRVFLLHVLPDGLPQKVRASAEKKAHHQLQRAAGLVGATSSSGRRAVEVSSEVCCGQAYVEIIRRARAAGADLIVLGRHGQRPVKDLFIGSTAERVIRTGDLPVLVVNRKALRSYRRPVLAVDLEDTSRPLIDIALRVLGPDVASATMVHAYHVPFEGFLTPGVSSEDMTELRKEYRKKAAAGLARLQAQLGDLGREWQTSIVRGDPRSVILAEVERRRADLLAVGTHGRSGLSHVLVGSVAEWIIQAAACDVLVGRPSRVSFELP